MIFLDEAGAKLNMTTLYGRALRSERLHYDAPFIRGNTISVIGAISMDEVVASLYGEWATDGAIFSHYIENSLAPQLKSDNVVIMDNIPFHLSKRVENIILETGASIILLPPYSPEYNPIELMWSKIKLIIRQLEPRTVAQFRRAIRTAFLSITKSDLIGWFGHCGYVSNH